MKYSLLPHTPKTDERINTIEVHVIRFILAAQVFLYRINVKISNKAAVFSEKKKISTKEDIYFFTLRFTNKFKVNRRKPIYL